MPNSAASLPAQRVAIVQSESESLHNPSLDVTGVLDDRERWRYRLFTDRTFEALLKAQAEFDCIVVGYNAIHRNPGIAPLLAQASVGVLVLHQLHLPADTTIGPAHPLAVADLPGGHQLLSLAPERELALEVLLNWPEAVNLDALHARAVTRLAPPPDTPWRPVLQVGDGRPVVIRSSLTHAPPLVACSLLLENGKPADRALLVNLIAFCAGGPPRTIVLGGPDSPWAGTLVRKLRLRRVSAVQLDAAAAELDYRCWPLIGVSDVIVPDVIVPSEPLDNHGEDDWLAGGGRLTRVNSETGELNVSYRAPDVRWVARRWSSWLQTGAGEARHSSVMATRAYLRTLAALEQELGPQPWLPDLSGHAAEVRDLVTRRLGYRDNLEGTIAATAALVEIDQLIPGAIKPERIERVRRWLRTAWAGAGGRDRIEIARVLHDRELLVAAVGGLPRPVSASTIVRLRRAAIACPAADLSFDLYDADRDAILAEIVTSLLAAADYLSSMAGVQCEPGLADGALAVDDVLLADAAVATLTKLGTITAPTDSTSATVEEVSAEALALIACAKLDAIPTSELVKIDTVPPAQFIEDVLRESLEVRQSNTEQRTEIARLHVVDRRAQRQLKLARNLLGAVVAVLALLVAVAVAVFLSAQTSGLPEVAAQLAGPATAFTGVLFVLGYPLKLRELSPDWLAKVASALADGAGSLRGALAEGLGRPPAGPEGPK